MSEKTLAKPPRRFKFRHRGRLGQVSIYFGKFLRMFLYQNDWKVLPMAALIAATVSMVVRGSFFVTMEGTLKGAFAMTLLSIWNGCFNSIQVICRERPILKREHRSGLHITSYIAGHMLYQGLLCLAQSALTIYVCRMMGVKFPSQGIITKWMLLDMGITVFLITYSADMLSLWISALVRTTTAAMTVMPFILIFQLVFSGGMFSMPEWAGSISEFTISNTGLKCVNALADYNNLPMSSIWTSINRLNKPGKIIPVRVTLGNALDLITDEDIAVIRDLRGRKISANVTVDTALETLGEAVKDIPYAIRADDSGIAYTLSDLVHMVRDYAREVEASDIVLESGATIGEAMDEILNLPFIAQNRDRMLKIDLSIHDLFQMIGEDKLKEFITENSKGINYRKAYIQSAENIRGYWTNLALFSLAFAALAVLTLEFIDKDKR